MGLGFHQKRKCFCNDGQWVIRVNSKSFDQAGIVCPYAHPDLAHAYSQINQPCITIFWPDGFHILSQNHQGMSSGQL
ncbi:hypothetical protein D3W54_10500 [Komagataeibacter medellinensis]|uniref:Transposase n=1 Tax=Komagataeibacter medellinensis TaxID=1177712 RepID=A0ABQ6VWH4_9PROT|nr:hypothetical protein D3W54_10500 [Komagataeibacter medellinensis]